MARLTPKPPPLPPPPAPPPPQAPEVSGVCVVSFGFDTNLGNRLLDTIADEATYGEWVIKDIRKDLKKDPATAIGHGEDGRSAQTQKIVIGQPNFPQLIHDLCKLVADGDRQLAIGCRPGCHRADTAARFLCEVLNYVTDTNGNRLFTARRYGISSCYGKKDFYHIMGQIKVWNASPWCVMEAATVKRDLYAYDAAMHTEASAQNWDQAWKLVFELWPSEPEGQPQPPAADEDNELPEPPKSKQRCSEGSESWSTFDRRVEVWNDTLITWSIDTTARMELFLLAQHSDDGYKEANAVIAKLLKKKSDNETMKNPSAFVHACVQNARSLISHNDGANHWHSRSRSSWQSDWW